MLQEAGYAGRGEPSPAAEPPANALGPLPGEFLPGLQDHYPKRVLVKSLLFGSQGADLPAQVS